MLLDFFFFFLVVIHTRCDGNKKPILRESFYNPMVSLKSGCVLSHLIEILCEKLFKVPLHPRPISPQIPRFAFGAGRERGKDGFKTLSCAQRVYSLPLLLSFCPLYHTDLPASVFIHFSGNLVLVSAAVSIYQIDPDNLPLPSGFPV